MAKFRGKIQDGTIDIPGLIIKIALIWFILTFLVFPNVNLLLRVFIKDEHFTLEAVSKIMRSARAMKSLKNRRWNWKQLSVRLKAKQFVRLSLLRVRL